MQIRAAAMGKFRTGPMRNPRPVLAAMAGARSGFVPLADHDHEIVMGLAGRFWANRGARPRNAAEFGEYRQPGAAKSAFNFRIEDAGGGWTRLGG